MVLLKDELLVQVAGDLVAIAQERLAREHEPERRSAERVPFHQVMCLATTHDAKADTNWRAMLSLNVSRGGLGLVSPTNPLQVGVVVVVDCCPSQIKQLLPGHVVRVNEIIPGLSEMGIQFQFQSELLEGIR